MSVECCISCGEPLDYPSGDGCAAMRKHIPKQGVMRYWEYMQQEYRKLDSGKIASDGGPSEYYDFPKGCETLNDLIEYKNMSFAQGNIFKAAYRLGNKDGISLEYDLKKIKYYADRMLNQIKESDNAPPDT